MNITTFFHVGILEFPSPMDLKTFSETFEGTCFILDYTYVLRENLQITFMNW